MWRNTVNVMRWAPHRWRFRTRSPNTTPLRMFSMSEYATAEAMSAAGR
jgi:hypothetical protein